MSEPTPREMVETINRIISESNTEELVHFRECIRKAAVMMPPTTTLRQFLIFLEFGVSDLRGNSISLSELKDQHDQPDNFGGKLFAKTTSSAFNMIFDDLKWLSKRPSDKDSRVKLVEMTPEGRKALFSITKKVDVKRD
ncbi:hypothetical protein PQU92_08520 [Asticcacaulis sp. BYS171W]|uniref:HTH marR-type domain-containing protein n=1 Tax=Asticcacaulis aquaticus TaxID=2984212 RepID=A0ABT5HTQ2_9CAUL|nr:hypothetical protein [Asticcacaulis aquaticus]MDC7683318.1 hypothetical protein [Asticcacaulis aquaticus]